MTKQEIPDYYWGPLPNVDCTRLASFLQDLGVKQPTLRDVAHTQNLGDAMPLARNALTAIGIDPKVALTQFMKHLEEIRPLN